jgi:hypothetical protein
MVEHASPSIERPSQETTHTEGCTRTKTLILLLMYDVCMRLFCNRNQLLIEGISPMVSMDFVSTTDLTTGIAAPMLIVNSTGPLYTKAASWEPLYYRPEDAACSLARANAQYQAAHPTGPLLLMNATVLSGPLNKEIGAWQVVQAAGGLQVQPVNSQGNVFLYSARLCKSPSTCRGGFDNCAPTSFSRAPCIEPAHS